MSDKTIHLELFPHERAVLLKWNYTPEVREQLEEYEASSRAATIEITPAELRWLAGDLTHAIVHRGGHDEDLIDLSERLDYVVDTGDGSLDSWF